MYALRYVDWSGTTINDNDGGKWDIFLVTSGQYPSPYPSRERKVKTHECDRCCEHIKHAILQHIKIKIIIIAHKCKFFWIHILNAVESAGSKFSLIIYFEEKCF